MSYVVLRLLGASEEDERMIKGRATLGKAGRGYQWTALGEILAECAGCYGVGCCQSGSSGALVRGRSTLSGSEHGC